MNRFLKHWRLTGRGEAFRAHVVSYADDFVILSRGCAAEALAWTKAVMTKLGLTLNEAKTSVKDARQERFDFLGYTFGPHRTRKDGHWYLGRKSVEEECSADQDEDRRHADAGDKGAMADGARQAEPAAARLVGVLRLWHALARRIGPSTTTSTIAFEPSSLRRHKVQGRGTRRFSRANVYGELGVLRLQRMHIGPPP